MSAYGTKVVAVLDTQSAFGVTIKTLKDNVDTLTGQMSTLLADAPETLDTLNEIAAAISDDPAFFTTMSAANTTLQANIDTLSTAAATARTALQTALQTAIDANALTSTNAEAALGTRLDSLELDPVTKTYVDAAVTNLIDAAPGVLDTLNEIAAAIGDDANFITTVNASIAAVQADVDANETASDAAETALSGRLDTLEADPTTATAVAAVQTDVDANQVTAANAVTAQNTAMLAAVAVVQADVDANETTAATAVATETARATSVEGGLATDIATVQADVDANEADRKTYFAWDSNLSKVINPVRGSRIDVGNNITFYPAAGYNTEIKGNLTTDNTTKVFFTLTDAANDSAAASAGVAVGQLYRNGSVVMIRVS